ncbi:triple tyrosine motif-containing protein [Chryseobacterium echinoideorum]|uniref:triple tyrosine motif-containing protein n=1 Tax=Chryseobacterium echinoideorum TaxID=1549648 RepID=UPI0016280C0D|nr:triple tyrosine motif-containing protein [Chryseobacterium echinoideorum]
MPFIQNYLPKDYGNHGKIWEINAADNGLVYMASENGVLEFDGQNWKRFRNYKGYTRSLHIANDSIIYVGADMDFGVYKKDKFQKFSYTSLYPYRKNTNGITEEFWGTYQIKNEIVFISHQNLYILYQDKISKIPAPVRFTDSFFVNGLLYLADDRKGLFLFDGKKLDLICSYPENTQLEIAGVFKHENRLRIITKNHGIFKISEKKIIPIPSEVNSFLEKNKVFSFALIADKYLAFGTVTDGLYITDLNGKIVQHINKNKGLPNNTILSLFYQKNGKLWLGLDYGIASIDISSSISYFYSVNGDFGTGYTALINGNTFFLGSNQGLYSADGNNFGNNQKNLPFNLIKGSDGQVWSLEKIDGNMYCGHDKGLFLVKDNVLQKINDEYGVSQIVSFRNNYVLTGNYKGISIYKKENGRLRFVKNMKYILGAISQIQIENDQTIWINIPNYGIIRTNLDQHFNPINRKIFLDSEFEGNFPKIFKNKGEIQIVTATHAYQYNVVKKKFELTEDKINRAVIKEELPGFYFPKKISSEYNFYPVYNGFAIEKRQYQKVNFVADLVFRKAQAFNNHHETAIHQQQSIGYKYNNFRFSFIIPNEEEVEYQYYLQGFSEEWSSWNTKNEADFLDLKEGDYTLQVKARKGNVVSAVKRFDFTVKPPWYRTLYSYILYGLLLITAFYFLRKHHQNKLKKQAYDFLKKQRESLRQQAEKHREEILIAKQKQMDKEQQNLKEEVRRKTIELATKAKDDEDKNRILSTINSKIKEIEDTPNISKIRLGEIRRMLNQYLHTEDHTFEIQMDELHQEFFKSMKVRFPNLSIYELRLCAYLRIGLNSKEMADIFQVLPSSINVSRSRLRKKLGLKPEDDLYNFLNGF